VNHALLPCRSTLSKIDNGFCPVTSRFTAREGVSRIIGPELAGDRCASRTGGLAPLTNRPPNPSDVARGFCSASRLSAIQSGQPAYLRRISSRGTVCLRESCLARLKRSLWPTRTSAVVSLCPRVGSPAGTAPCKPSLTYSWLHKRLEPQ